MKTILAAAAFAIAGLGVAHAMPMAPLGTTGSADIIQVAQGCGPGYARGSYGRCRPMGYVVRPAPPAYVVRRPPPPVYVVRRPPPPVYVVRPGRGCGPGFVWRGGRCRPF